MGIRNQPIERTPTVPVEPIRETRPDDLVSIRDLSPQQVKAVIDLAALIKVRASAFRGALAGKQVVMFFEKPSLRTRLTFQAGMASLGGDCFFMDQTHSRIDQRESLSDIAHNVERWVHGIVLRTFDHCTVEDLAAHASIPVINALSDLEHPCQALADFFTLQEKFGNFEGLRIAYVGDGNNMAHSLLLTAASLGSCIRVATPKKYAANTSIVEAAREIALETGASIQILNDPAEAVAGADAVYTDTWASMGQEHEAKARATVFAPYQVNDKLMGLAAPHAVFMHCLPAHRGEEVTDNVIDSARSIVFDQAENRLHIQKAILLMLLGGGNGRMPVRSAHV
jgi:ornithine carbamoyltransferase